VVAEEQEVQVLKVLVVQVEEEEVLLQEAEQIYLELQALVVAVEELVVRVEMEDLVDLVL